MANNATSSIGDETASDWSGFDDSLDISDDEFAKAILAGRRAEALSVADPFELHRK